MSEIAYANQEQMFAIAETTSGTLKKPTASERMYSVGPVDFGQDQEFLDDEQVRATASRLKQLTGRMMPGEYGFDSYVKPSGTVGAEPEHDLLFRSLMGAGDIDGDGNYAYTLENELPSFSFWVKKGHTVFAFRGATVEGADFGISGDALSLISWSGKYMRELRCGTSSTISINGSVLTMPPAACESYSEGMWIYVGATKTGPGYRILKVNPAGNKMTLNGNPPGPARQEVSPWWPTAGEEKGYPQHGKLGKVTVNGRETIVLTANVSMVNNIKYYIDEKNNVMTAERYGRPKIREIEGSLEMYFLKRGPSYYYRSEYQIPNALVIPVGKVDGKIMELQIPYAEYRTPKISGDEEFQESVPFIAVASTGLNDEFKIVFK